MSQHTQNVRLLAGGCLISVELYVCFSFTRCLTKPSLLFLATSHCFRTATARAPQERREGVGRALQEYQEHQVPRVVGRRRVCGTCKCAVTRRGLAVRMPTNAHVEPSPTEMCAPKRTRLFLVIL